MYKPSEIACAAVVLSINDPHIMILDGNHKMVTPGLPDILLEYTNFNQNRIKEICEVLARLASMQGHIVTSKNEKLTSIREKYASSQFLGIGEILGLSAINTLLYIHGAKCEICLTHPQTPREIDSKQYNG